MKEFEISGTFWIRDREADRVAGVLKFSVEKGVRLELLGSLDPAGPVGADASRYPMIWGELHRTAPDGGSAVTLFDAFTTRVSWSSSSGTKLETIVANRGFVGDGHLPHPDHLFVCANVSISGLASWAGAPTFQVHPGEAGKPLVEQLPNTVRRAAVANAVIEFKSSWHMQVRSSPSVAEVGSRFELSITPERASTEINLLQEFVLPLRNLVTLATNRHAPLQRVYLAMDDRQPWPTGADLCIGALREPSDGDWRDGLFAFPDNDDALQGMLSRWVSLSSRHRRILGLIFGLIESPPRFAEMRFEMTLRAVDLFARRIAAKSRTAFVEGAPWDAESVVGDGEAFAREIETVCKGLWDDGPPSGMRLTHLTEALLWLLKVQLAIEAGASRDEVLNSRAFVRHAKWLCARLTAPQPAASRPAESSE